MEVIANQVKKHIILIALLPNAHANTHSLNPFQAHHQQAGDDGIKTILEKLLFTVKFGLHEGRAANSTVRAVEITEDTVLGKAPPLYHSHSLGSGSNNNNNGSGIGGRRCASFRKSSQLLKPIMEEGSGWMDAVASSVTSRASASRNSSHRTPVMFTDYEEDVLRGMEL